MGSKLNARTWETAYTVLLSINLGIEFIDQEMTVVIIEAAVQPILVCDPCERYNAGNAIDSP